MNNINFKKSLEDVLVEIEWDRISPIMLAGVDSQFPEIIEVMKEEFDFTGDELYLMGLMMIGRYGNNDSTKKLIGNFRSELFEYWHWRHRLENTLWLGLNYEPNCVGDKDEDIKLTDYVRDNPITKSVIGGMGESMKDSGIRCIYWDEGLAGSCAKNDKK